MQLEARVNKIEFVSGNYKENNSIFRNRRNENKKYQIKPFPFIDFD